MFLSLQIEGIFQKVPCLSLSLSILGYGATCVQDVWVSD